MEDDIQVKLCVLNPYIVCKICTGYLISATTVTECLHTFCKSCLVKHLEENNTCPECNIVIHQSHPLQYIKFDRTMQDIVYKLVPGLMENELERERSFYKSRGTVCPKDIPNIPITNGPDQPGTSFAYADQSHQVTDYHRLDEQVNILLEAGSGMKPLQRKFIRVSAQATIRHVKKYICSKIDCLDQYDQIELLCNGEPQGKDHTLKFVYVTKWRFRDPPLKLKYQQNSSHKSKNQ